MKRSLSIISAVLLIVSSLTGCATNRDQSNSGSLKFAAEAPAAPDELPLLRLQPQSAPIELINRVLASADDHAKLGRLDSAFFRTNALKVSDDLVGFMEKDYMKAWADQRTGDAAIYPTMEKLKPSSRADLSAATTRAREILQSSQFIAKDDTRFVVDEPQILNGASLVREGGTTRIDKAATPHAAYVLARRFVGDYRVDGPGSRALVVVGAGGSVEGLTRVWKSAQKETTIKAAHSPNDVQKRIARQLSSAARNSTVVVDEIKLAYYDGNQNYLQPVYRFTARIHHLTKEAARTDDDFVIGYVPFGSKAVEALPDLGKTTGPKPKTPARTAPKGNGEEPPMNDPIVGRYVVRNDDPGWVNDANAFWSSISSSWTHSLFSNSQYYWAYPRLFTNQKNSFINAMNLALIEVHGDWWFYTTYQNWGDGVNINGDIPSPGYGPSAGGRLADWVIHSCEVVPAPDDTASWPDPWWNIFGGVRNVVGYRTIMYISDGAGGPYGTSLGNVAPVVSSWLSDVISLNAYSGHPTTAAHGGVVRPMGRPSTISMCGHDGDSVFSTSTLGRASCLTVWWFPD